MVDCNVPAPAPSCDSPADFLCPGTSVCVNRHTALCDGVDDCGDGSDELNCGMLRLFFDNYSDIILFMLNARPIISCNVVKNRKC